MRGGVRLCGRAECYGLQIYAQCNSRCCVASPSNFLVVRSAACGIWSAGGTRSTQATKFSLVQTHRRENRRPCRGPSPDFKPSLFAMLSDVNTQLSLFGSMRRRSRHAARNKETSALPHHHELVEHRSSAARIAASTVQYISWPSPTKYAV